MSRISRGGVLVLLGLGAVLAHPARTRAEAQGDGKAEIARRAGEVLSARCASCHAGGHDEGGLACVLDARRLIERGFVVPGEPGRSELADVASGHAPVNGQNVALVQDELAKVKAWILAQAPELRSEPARASSSREQVRSEIEKNLAGLEAGSRPFARFFTLEHLANAGRSEDELACWRSGLAFLLSSLSWKAESRSPAAVDAAKTILRIDLRDYGWDAASWKRILARYPYGVASVDGAAEKACGLDPASELCSVRADWFVAAASRPPLYHELLALPESARELEKRLEVGEDARRSGFPDSGESLQHRIVERRASRTGSYWKTYDFQWTESVAATKSRDLARRPLGPGSGPHDFFSDGSEIIFHLPNGLQGFMVTGASGKRLDKAPVANVWNREARDGPVENVNAISCLGCHANGPRAVPADTVRARFEADTNVEAALKESVRSLYAEKDELSKLAREDSRAYLEARARTGCDPGVAADPIVGLVRQYEDAVSARLATAELGCTQAALASAIDSAKLKDLAPLGLELPVARAVFEKGFSAAAKALEAKPLAFEAEVALTLLPAPPGYRRFEAPFGDRILSCELDRSWKFVSREKGLLLERGDGSRMVFSGKRNDAPDLDYVKVEDFMRLRPRFIDLKTWDNKEPSMGRTFVVLYDSERRGRIGFDVATLKGGRAVKGTGRVYRVASETPKESFDQDAVTRIFRTVKIAKGSEALPDDPVTSPLPETLKEAGFESDYEAALARAKREGKLVMAFVKPRAFWFT